MKTRNYLKDILYDECVGDALGVPVGIKTENI